MFLERRIWYLLNQRTEYACQDQTTCTLVNRVCKGEAVRGSSLHVGENQRKSIHTCKWQRIVLINTARHIRSITKKHTQWPRCWWIIQHTTTPRYNPFSNPVEHFHRTLAAMLRTRRPRVQEKWDLWLNVSVFANNTTLGSSTGVTSHYAIFRCKAMLPVDWVFPTPSVEKRTTYHWTGDMMEERQHPYKSMREVQGGTLRCTTPWHRISKSDF